MDEAERLRRHRRDEVGLALDVRKREDKTLYIEKTGRAFSTCINKHLASKE